MALEVPENLWQARDELVDYALDGGPVPSGFQKIKEWFATSSEAEVQLEYDCAENSLVDGYLTPWRALECACDVYLRDHFALEETAKITTAQRLEFTRHRLKQLSEQCELPYETAGAITLKSSSGRSCLIGYLAELHGQCGHCFQWQGVFPSEQSWSDYLEDRGYFYISGEGDVERLPDEAVLEINLSSNS